MNKVKKISRCQLQPAHKEVMPPEVKKRFDKWIAVKRYRQRLNLITVKGGLKVPPSPLYVF